MTNIIIIDKANLIRTCIKNVLNKIDDFKVIGDYSSIQDAENSVFNSLKNGHIILFNNGSISNNDLTEFYQLEKKRLPILILCNEASIESKIQTDCPIYKWIQNNNIKLNVRFISLSEKIENLELTIRNSVLNV